MEIINKRIDGKALAEVIKDEIKQQVSALKIKRNKIPHLAAILVGNDPASEAYVGHKVKACHRVGIKSTLIKKADTITESELLETVASLNNDPDIDGFIVQLPLPKGINELKITNAIDVNKDVDGFHPINFGKMAQGLDCFIPATPFGILTLLERYAIETEGKHIVIVGRSNIVGTPMSVLMSRKANPGNATVTITHSRTRDLTAELKRADIIIAAIGIPNFIDKEMIKAGAVIIDVGINRIKDSTKKSGTKLVGDVNYDSVFDKCSAITPVPGGVGPMTVVSLLTNTLKASKYMA